jgi:hypothetical protein
MGATLKRQRPETLDMEVGSLTETPRTRHRPGPPGRNSPLSGADPVRRQRGTKSVAVRSGRIALSIVGAMATADVLALARSLKSVWTIEILVCMFRHRHRQWSELELVRELRASSPVVSRGLELLTSAGLVSRIDSAFQIDFADARLEEITAELAEVYSRRPLSLTSAIFEGNNAVRQFSDAFRLKGDK